LGFKVCNFLLQLVKSRAKFIGLGILNLNNPLVFPSALLADCPLLITKFLNKISQIINSCLHLHRHVKIVLEEIFTDPLGIIPEDLPIQ